MVAEFALLSTVAVENARMPLEQDTAQSNNAEASETHLKRKNGWPGTRENIREACTGGKWRHKLR